MAQVSNRNCSHPLSTWIEAQESNDVTPKQLLAYMLARYKNNTPNLTYFNSVLDEIIECGMKGMNPNDIELINNIKYYINTLNHINHKEYLDKLMKLDYGNNIGLLIFELIKCAIDCPISYKGYDFKEQKFPTIPELCVDIIYVFQTKPVKFKDPTIQFNSELLRASELYFKSFFHDDKLFDEHNGHFVDNYKGYMTFLGLLYAKGLIKTFMMRECSEIIYKTLFKLKPNGECARTSVECNNLYKGYEHLLNHTIHFLNSKIPSQINEYNKIEKTKNVITLMLANDNPFVLPNSPHLFSIVNTYLTSNNTYNKTLKFMFDIMKKNINHIKNDNLIKMFEKLESHTDKLTQAQLEQTFSSVENLHKIINNKLIFGAVSELIYSIYQYNNFIGPYITHVDYLLSTHTKIFESNRGLKTRDTKNQLTPPLRNYTLMMHHSLGKQLNQLHGLFDSVQGIYARVHLCDNLYTCG